MTALVELVLPRQRETVPAARTLIVRTLSALRVDRDDVEDLALAVTEACANVVRHATGCPSYRVVIDLDQDDCSVEVSDWGPGFVPFEPEMPEPEATGGRGLAKMDALVDRADIRSQPGRGTAVTLIKRLRRGTRPVMQRA